MLLNSRATIGRIFNHHRQLSSTAAAERTSSCREEKQPLSPHSLPSANHDYYSSNHDEHVQPSLLSSPLGTDHLSSYQPVCSSELEYRGGHDNVPGDGAGTTLHTAGVYASHHRGFCGLPGCRAQFTLVENTAGWCSETSPGSRSIDAAAMVATTPRDAIAQGRDTVRCYADLD